MTTSNAPLSFRRYVTRLPLELLTESLRVFFWPRKPDKPIGYWARDRHGRWELRVPAYQKDFKR